MKTQIVYVLVSSETDVYLEQAWLSASSLRLHNPDVKIVLLVDESTRDSLKGKRANAIEPFDNVMTVKTPQNYSPIERSRYIKTSVRQNIAGNFLFVDCDTIISGSLDEIDSIEANVAAVPDFHGPFNRFPTYRQKIGIMKDIYNINVADDPYYFNSGVIFVKDNDVAHKLYEEWHKNWLYQRKSKYYFDQPALQKANIDLNHIIQIMDGKYNCQIITSIQYLHQAKIIHFYGKPWFQDAAFSPFLSKTLYQSIKENGYILDEIESLIRDCKSRFESPSIVVGSDEFVFMNSQYGRKLITTYENRGLIYFLIKLLTLLVEGKKR